MRSPTWVTPAIGGTTSNQFQSDKRKDDKPGHQQFTFTEEQKREFLENPEKHLKFRKSIEAEVNWMADVFNMGTQMQADVQRDMTKQMRDRIGRGHDELASKLIPAWPPGCRRLTPGDGYLEALTKDNVIPVFGSIKEIKETSVVMEDGTEHDVDVLVSHSGGA
jgi:hypothetical protein